MSASTTALLPAVAATADDLPAAVVAALDHPPAADLGVVEAAGIPFAFRSWGEAAAPPLLLIHGLASDGREWSHAGDELAAAGAVGRVTNGGRLVGWLIPATKDEERAEELIASGRLRPGRRSGHVGRRRLPRRTDGPALSETLEQMRNEEDR